MKMSFLNHKDYDGGITDFLNGNLEEIDELPNDEIDENLYADEEEGNDAISRIKVEPKKRSVRNPRPRLTIANLTGTRGIHTIEDYFKNIKFKGKGAEKEDLNEIMRRLQHWGHRLYPMYKFDDILNNIERLSRKKPLQIHMSRYRLGLLECLKQPFDSQSEEIEKKEDNRNEIINNDVPFDEFDALLDQQIAISKLAENRHNTKERRSIGSNNDSMFDECTSEKNDSLPSVKPVSSTESTSTQLTSEQIARISENRRLAQERLAARKLAMKEQSSHQL